MPEVRGDGALDSFKEEIEPILDQFCYDCHGYGSDKGGVVLDGFESESDILDHGLWLRALRNVRAELMPPAKEAQPDAEQAAKIIEWIKGKAFALDSRNPDPGRVTVRRLNRVEYRNTVFDLIGVDYETDKEFPADDTGHGFDNIGEVLTVSPMLMEKYLDAAQAIISQVVPTQPLAPAVRRVEGARFLDADPEAGVLEDGFADLSYYKPAAVSSTFVAERAGTYQITLDARALETYVDNIFDLNRCCVAFKLNGKPLLDQEFAREGDRRYQFDFEVALEPGEHELTFEVTPLTPDAKQERDLRMRVERVTVLGPVEEALWTRPEGYERFFPGQVPAELEARRAYTRGLLRDFATRAFRRPVDEPTVARLLTLSEAVAGQEGNTYETGVAQAMVAVLASPRFLFREEGVEPLRPGEEHPYVDEYALASRLSYFLWSSMPDAELIALAGEGRLRENLAEQTRRLLDHPRSQNFVKNFVGQWLQARDIPTVPIESFDIFLREHPIPDIPKAREAFRRIVRIDEADRTPEEAAEFKWAFDVFIGAIRQPRPKLTDELRFAMQRETELFFEYILREDRNVVELLDANYTFLNEELAAFYGIEGVVGEEMRKVDLPEGSPRGGILTQGTVLSVTSNPTRTSPVKRGVFILDNILGTPPAPPPPNIPSLESVASPEELAALSLRETLALHAASKSCSSCHERMDPLGLALENFNAMGVWRESEHEQPIDASGQLVTGEAFNDVRDLKRILATDRRADFFHCLAEKLLTYALGRGLDYYDVHTLDHLVETLEQTEGSFQSLMMEVVQSAPFQKRRHDEGGETIQTASAAESAPPAAASNLP